jgi:hypothetical protein
MPCDFADDFRWRWGGTRPAANSTHQTRVMADGLEKLKANLLGSDRASTRRNDPDRKGPIWSAKEGRSESDCDVVVREGRTELPQSERLTSSH